MMFLCRLNIGNIYSQYSIKTHTRHMMFYVLKNVKYSAKKKLPKLFSFNLFN